MQVGKARSCSGFVGVLWVLILIWVEEGRAGILPPQEASPPAGDEGEGGWEGVGVNVTEAWGEGWGMNGTDEGGGSEVVDALWSEESSEDILVNVKGKTCYIN